MTTPDNQFSALKDPDNPILDSDGLAALLGISAASIPSIRSRSPEKLPPSYLRRPLRWRRETVMRWIQEQEEKARKRAERGAPPDAAEVGTRRSTTPVRQVWMHIRVPAIAGGTILLTPSSGRRNLMFRDHPSSFQTALRRSKSRNRSRRFGRTTTDRSAP